MEQLETGPQAKLAPSVEIFNIQGTRQYIVSTGGQECLFTRWEDVQRFIGQILPEEQLLEIQTIAQSQWAQQQNLLIQTQGMRSPF